MLIQQIDSEGRMTEVHKAPIYKEIVKKPWGQYENVHIEKNYKVKILTINPGHRLSLQRHKYRDEHWFIVEGYPTVEISSLKGTLWPHDSLEIQQETWHRVTNDTDTPIIIVEVQTGNCFEEDIERKEDDYGRTPLYDG